MKFSLIVCVFLLTVNSSLSVNITVSGTEGRPVIITCSYAEGLKYAYKYFYRGYYRGRVSILESDGIETFAINGRFSLKDNHKTRSFTVTISYLKMDDAGPYGCKAGHGYENYKQVELIVIRAPETTTRVQISTSSITTYTNSSTEHTSTARSDKIFHVLHKLTPTWKLNFIKASTSVKNKPQLQHLEVVMFLNT